MHDAPLKLSDGQVEMLQSLGAAIPRHLRSEWLQIIATALGNVPDFGDGQVYKAARTAQQKILHGPRSNGRNDIRSLTLRSILFNPHETCYQVAEFQVITNISEPLVSFFEIGG
jgi:hypothetical protein